MLGKDLTVILDGKLSQQIRGTTEREHLLSDAKWQNYIVSYKRFADKA